MQSRTRTGRCVALLVIAIVGLAGAAGAATIETDKLDYAPEETVYIAGSGWQPGETVVMRLVEDPQLCGERTLSSVADDNGSFFNSDLVLEWHDFHVTFTVLATGVSSGLTAEATFTDGLLSDTISVSGDSISRAFDARSGSILDLCNYGDNVTRAWATGDSHGSTFCGAGSEGIFSHAERLECAKGNNITNFNDAASGANMRADFFNQAVNIKNHLLASPAPRYAPVFMGHNDVCTNTTSKTGNSCSGDQDPNNYCRTTPVAFEREFRRGMDQLIQIPSVRVLVESLARVSMLCSLGSKSSCGVGFGVSCSSFWGSGLFNVCSSLTINCSDTRKIDAYNTSLAYNNILRSVTAEYAAIPTGGTSATGAVKASDVAIRFGEGVFNYKFQAGDLSCCDCFHPSIAGQQKLADFTYAGLQCSSATPCCAQGVSDPLTNANCSANDTTTFYPGGYWAGNPCGNGIVDPGEQCDLGAATNGQPGACCAGNCQFVAAGTSCRAAAGECDLGESCSGSSAVCPADAKKASGTGCTSDGNPCTLDRCDGTSVDCQHPAGNAGTVCRAAAGVCDVAETCTGTSASCPSDQFVASGTVCRPSAGECDPAESCTGSGADCPADDKKASGTACTDDGNPCSRDECDGTSDACQHPAGNAGALCRAAAGICDVAESCTGTSTACPADVFKPASTVCRPSAGECDPTESCTGSSAACPADGKKDAGTACTDDGNPCSRDECDGSSDDCQHPAGNAGTECRAAAGICDVAESCTGTSTTCPADDFKPATTVCRASGGECDVTENCTGSSADCPADAKKGAGTACTEDGNPCSRDECDGGSDACQHPAGNAGAVCRAVAGPCDVAEACTGASTACPGDDFKPASTVCRAAAGQCDLDDNCTGSSASCPPDAKSTALCRPSAGECDVAESCNGISNDCPADGFKPATAACTDDGNVCTDDHCNGSGACVHPNNTAPCTDGNACTAPDVCSNGACVSGPPVYGFTGFFPPVDNLPVINVGNAGRTYPVKWQLPLCAGGFVSRLDVVLFNPLRYRQVACDSFAPQDTLVADTSGDSGLRYDSGANQYHFNWKTSSGFAGKCYELLVELDNGTTQVSRYKFK